MSKEFYTVMYLSCTIGDYDLHLDTIFKKYEEKFRATYNDYLLTFYRKANE